MDEDDQPAIAYEHVTTTHAEIRRWVRQRGGRPVTVTDDADNADDAGGSERLAVQIPGTNDGNGVEIDWEEFFERFEAEGLAFAYATDPGPGAAGVDYALIDRDRATETDGERAEPEERRTVDHPEGRESESRSEARKREAIDEANADAHRDEPPFNSYRRSPARGRERPTGSDRSGTSSRSIKAGPAARRDRDGAGPDPSVRERSSPEETSPPGARRPNRRNGRRRSRRPTGCPAAGSRRQ